MKKRLIVVFVAIMAIALLLTGCSSGSASETRGAVVGSVDGVNIYQGDMDYHFATYYQYYYEKYYNYFLSLMGVDMLDEESAADLLADCEYAAWQTVVDIALINKIAEDYGFTFDAEYLIDLLPWGNYQYIKTGTLQTEIYNALYEELLAAKTVSDEDTQAAYDEDPSLWQGRQTSHILIACDPSDEAALAEAMTKAMGLIDELNNGADFATLATEHSDDKNSAVNGGKIESYINSEGNAIDGSNSYYAEYVAGAYALEAVGDYTLVPVQSSAGLHIIKLDDIWSTFEDAKAAVADSLKTVSNEEVDARFQEVLAEARANAVIVDNYKYKYYVPGEAEPEEGDGDNDDGNVEDNTNGDNPEDSGSDDPENLDNHTGEDNIDGEDSTDATDNTTE